MFIKLENKSNHIRIEKRETYHIITVTRTAARGEWVAANGNQAGVINLDNRNNSTIIDLISLLPLPPVRANGHRLPHTTQTLINHDLPTCVRRAPVSWLTQSRFNLFLSPFRLVDFPHLVPVELTTTTHTPRVPLAPKELVGFG